MTPAMTVRAALVAACAAGAGAPAVAQTPPQRHATPEWIVERWGGEQGLRQGTINGFAQTPDGYLWLATLGGLVRFDGVRFTYFTTREYPALGSDRLIDVQVAPDGALWIASDRGLVRFAGGVFEVLLETTRPDGGYTNRMLVDSSGAWLAATITGLTHVTRTGVQRFTEHGVAAGWVGNVVRDGAGNIWISRAQGRLLVRRAGSDRFTPVRVLDGALEATGLLGISHDGRPWFVTSRGPALQDGDRLIPLDVPAGAMVRAHQRGHWFMAGRTLWYVEGDTRRSFPLPPESGVDQLHQMFVDREGTLWLGTSISGLVRLRRREVQLYLREDGLASEQVTALLRDRRGRLWVGSSCAATSLMMGGMFRALAEPGCVFSLAEGPDGTVWAGVYGGGLYRITPDGRVERPHAPTTALPNQTVLALLTDPDGSVWAGTELGLAHYRDGTYTRYGVADGLPSAQIHYLMRDRQGTLWVGTVAGLARFDDPRFTAWTTREGLANNFVRAIHQDADGVYWIGTYGGGLSRFDGEAFVTVSSAHGLHDDVVSAILEDARGNLWMSGNRGIHRASRAALNAFANGTASHVIGVGYGPSDGLLTPETNGGFQPSAWQDPDGRLWFATVRGLATIDPAAAVPALEPPRLALEWLAVDGDTTAITDTVRVPVGSRHIEIGFTALTSVAPEQARFRYQLEGLDDGWVEVGTRRTAYYSRLRPGRYTFSMTAAGRDGPWNPQPAAMTILVPPAWYATSWFRAGAALGFLLVGAALVNQRAVRARARRDLERAFTRQLIQGQEGERRRLAGEIHDSLGQDLLVMKTRAVQALRSEDLGPDARPHVAAIAEVAATAVEHAREVSHGLRPYQLDHLGLAASLRGLATQMASAGGFAVTVRVDAADSLTRPDLAIHVFRIVQEALNNVLKHAAASAVTVALEPTESGARLTVADDGRGMVTGENFGLAGIRQRVAMLGGRMTVSSTPGRGTRLDIALPEVAP